MKNFIRKYRTEIIWGIVFIVGTTLIRQINNDSVIINGIRDISIMAFCSIMGLVLAKESDKSKKDNDEKKVYASGKFKITGTLDFDKTLKGIDCSIHEVTDYDSKIPTDVFYDNLINEVLNSLNYSKNKQTNQ